MVPLTLIIYLSLVHADIIKLICPAGNEYFNYNTNSKQTAGQQAYKQCKSNICPEKQWTSSAVIDHCSGPVPSYMAPACDVHDMCYIIPGITQLKCDNWFESNMHLICKNYCPLGGTMATMPMCTVCTSGAIAAQTSVRVFEKFYYKAQGQGLLFNCKGESDKIKVIGSINSLADVKTGEFKANEPAHGYFIQIGKGSKV